MKRKLPSRAGTVSVGVQRPLLMSLRAPGWQHNTRTLQLLPLNQQNQNRKLVVFLLEPKRKTAQHIAIMTAGLVVFAPGMIFSLLHSPPTHPPPAPCPPTGQLSHLRRQSVPRHNYICSSGSCTQSNKLSVDTQLVCTRPIPRTRRSRRR